MDEMPALVEATRKGGTIFDYISIRGKFRFTPDDTTVCTKISKATYCYVSGGPTFRTGPRTTVYPVAG